MSTELPVEVPPPEGPGPRGKELQPAARLRLSKGRLAVAFTVAALADGISLYLTFAPPAQWAADVVTALLLFMVLGLQWILLPALILEAIPGLYVFPFWVLVVGAVAVWGTARPNLKSILPTGKFGAS